MISFVLKKYLRKIGYAIVTFSVTRCCNHRSAIFFKTCQKVATAVVSYKVMIFKIPFESIFWLVLSPRTIENSLLWSLCS